MMSIEPDSPLGDYFSELLADSTPSAPNSEPSSKVKDNAKCLADLTTEQEPSSEKKENSASQKTLHDHTSTNARAVSTSPLTSKNIPSPSLVSPAAQSSCLETQKQVSEAVPSEKPAFKEDVPAAPSPALLEAQKERLQLLLNQPVIAPSAKPKEGLERETQIAIDAPVSAKVSTLVDLNTEAKTEQFDQAAEQGSLENSEAKKEAELEDGGLPGWAQEDFDALLFDVGGLTLAVPLVSLGHISPLDQDKLTPLFGQSEWFMGMMPTQQAKLKIVNTALFVMPEKYDERFIEQAQYTISLNGTNWALAVNSVNQPVRLSIEDIKWRTERSKRPWLAGTVKASMCALLDVEKMGKMLNAEERPRR